MQNTAELVTKILEQERRSRGLTWREIAEEHHVNLATLWRWRRGRALGQAADVLLPLAIKHCAQLSEDPAVET